MVRTHFKRQGSAGLLILIGLSKKYHVEYDHRNGFLKVEEGWEEVRTWNGKNHIHTFYKTILFRKFTPCNNGKENFAAIQESINDVIDYKITIEGYIESYHIAAKDNPNDRHMINGVDITGMDTRQVLEECNITLIEYFKPWRVDRVSEYLKNPSEKILNMMFSELYSVIYENCIKHNFKDIFTLMVM